MRKADDFSSASFLSSEAAYPRLIVPQDPQEIHFPEKFPVNIGEEGDSEYTDCQIRKSVR